MKAYKDIFGKKLTKEDVVQAVIHTVRSNSPYPASLSRNMQVGYGKAVRLMSVLYDGGVITGPDDGKNRKVLLKEDAAVNAALRQLKKGKK